MSSLTVDHSNEATETSLPAATSRTHMRLHNQFKRRRKRKGRTKEESSRQCNTFATSSPMLDKEKGENNSADCDLSSERLAQVAQLPELRFASVVFDEEKNAIRESKLQSPSRTYRFSNREKNESFSTSFSRKIRHKSLTNSPLKCYPNQNHANQHRNKTLEHIKSKRRQRFFYTKHKNINEFSYSREHLVHNSCCTRDREFLNYSKSLGLALIMLAHIVVVSQAHSFVQSDSPFLESSDRIIKYSIEDAKSQDSAPLPLPPLEPQPLIYRALHEFGSGDGYRSSSSSSSASSSVSIDQSYSSVSPALIEAKCWNNYADDNDCKHLNVITAPNSDFKDRSRPTDDSSTLSSSQLSTSEDSIITPVVIFESTSPVGELNPYGSFGQNNEDNNGYLDNRVPIKQYDSDDNRRFHHLAPPYSSPSTTTPSPLSHQRNRYRPTTQSPTANDIYSAPSATATLLPDSDLDNRYQPVTRPSAESGGSGVFVATPTPKHRPKTTTSGRKCRDENDADCDEPDESETGSDSDDDDSDDEEDSRSSSKKISGDRKGAGNGMWKNRVKISGSGRDNDVTGATTDPESSGDDDDNNNNNNKININEIGSGNGAIGGPNDDNEDGSDDGDDNDADGSSGNGSSGEIPQTSVSNEQMSTTSVLGINTVNRVDNDRQQTVSTTEQLLVTPVTPILITPTLPELVATPTSDRGDFEAGSSSIGQTNAEIEVIVHSTLPPSFPITTQLDIADDQYGTTTMSNIISTLPDDTVKSKPIFPSSTSRSSSSSNSGDGLNNNNGDIDDNSINESGDSMNAPTTTMDSDLDTFKPIPMQEQWPERSLLNPFAKNGSNYTGNDGDSETQQQSSSPGGAQDNSNNNNNNNIASRFKFEPPPIGGKFNDLWQHPTRSPTNPSDSPINSDQTNSDLASSGITGRHRSSASSASTSELAGSPTAPHRVPDVLPTMILYAAIIIIATTALIFVTTAFIYYWRSNARREALLNKTNLMNGAVKGQMGPFMGHPMDPTGGAGMPQLSQRAPMMTSMSQSSRLIAADGEPQMHVVAPGGGHEPVLMSTYAPGKGVNGGKVTTGLARQDIEANMLIEEDVERDNDEEDGSIITASNNNNLDNNHVATSAKTDDNYRMQAGDRSGPRHQSSWSTNEESAAGAGSGTGSGSRTGSDSQQTRDGIISVPASSGVNGQQNSHPLQSHHNQQAPPQQAPQQAQYQARHPYQNSLSDERQNSGSISDSQCSQVDGQTPMRPPMHPTGPPSHQQDQIMQPGVYDPRSQYNGYCPPPGPYPQNQGPIQMMLPAKMVGSRSIEDLRFQQHQQLQAGYVRPPQPYYHPPHLSRQQTMPPPRQLLQYPTSSAAMFKQQQLMSMTNSSCASTPTHMPQNPSQQVPVYLPSPSDRFSSAYSIGDTSQNGFRGGPGSIGGPQSPFSGSPNQPMVAISPRRVAMNPLATLGKRGVMPGVGLNRNIYSEDSSSLLTTSPSLVRTSSSSSFAFNTSQAGSIRAKPLLDASGHIINDYTQSHANHINGTNAPPVFGRKARSDAWYV